MNPPAATFDALTAFIPWIVPEMILGFAACVMFLGGTLRGGRSLWASVALVSVGLAALALARMPAPVYANEATARAALYAGPLIFDNLTLLVRVIALAGSALLILASWDQTEPETAADYHACLLVIAAGVSFAAASIELITLFLALELISIPTYILLYLTRNGPSAQEAALKYFLLSIFSSAFLLFGFSYLYGLTGTTNMPAIHDALASGRDTGLSGLALVALVMVVAALGFRITAVPFHFYAPDVYQGTSSAAAAFLASVPKVAGFAALVRLLGFVPFVVRPASGPPVVESNLLLAEQVPVLLWIMAAVTMTLGNVLGLLQDNVKRMLAYSSIANAGYMLIGLAVAPRLMTVLDAPRGGVEAVLFYLVAYGVMTIGGFTVLAYLSTPERSVETVDDLSGLVRTHPGMALLMVLFLFSMIGMPLTAGFAGKLFLFLSALAVPMPSAETLRELSAEEIARQMKQVEWFRILALIGAVNAAIAAWYYLRVAAVMFLREPLQPIAPSRVRPALATLALCALLTVGFGTVWVQPLSDVTRAAADPRKGERVATETPARPAIVAVDALPR